MSREPVIVVGAGPAGLALAVSLVQQDVEVVVLESEPRLPHDLRAGTFHPPTMELLGTANWWLPKWLDRAVPTLSVEPEVAREPVRVG